MKPAIQYSSHTGLALPATQQTRNSNFELIGYNHFTNQAHPSLLFEFKNTYQQLQVVQIQRPAQLKSLCANKKKTTQQKKHTSQKTDKGPHSSPPTAVLSVACCPC